MYKKALNNKNAKDKSLIARVYVSNTPFQNQLTHTKDWLLFETPTNTSLFLTFQTTVRGEIEK